MPKDDRQRVSQGHEKRAAAAHSARQHAGSGSGSRRMDMSTQDQLIECKTVLKGKRTITIKDDDLSLLIRQSAQRDISPVMDIELAGRAWVLIPRGDYLELRD